MKESILDLSKSLLKGLLPVVGTNLEGLDSCKNARPYGVGMEYVCPYAPYLALVGVHPFPQLLVSEKFVYVASQTGIYEVVNDALVIKKSQSATTHYDLADFKDSVVLAGNGHTLFRQIDGTLVSVANVPEASACASFNGLLLLGNISSWDQSTDVDSSTLAWAARLLSPEFRLAIDEVPTGAGYIKLFCGDILRIICTEKKVFVFGKKGISILGMVSDPIPTLGVEKEIAVTIKYKESIVLAEDKIVFVDSRGFVSYLDTGKGSVVKVGYSHIFANKRSTAFYDNQTEEVAICDGEQTILINQFGVGSIAQATTSGGLIDDEYQVVVTNTDTFDFELIGCPQDMGYNALKTLYIEEYNCETDGTVTIRGVSGGPLNIGMKIVTQSDFQSTLNISNLTFARITGLVFRWKLTDKRSVRGRNDYQTTT